MDSPSIRRTAERIARGAGELLLGYFGGPLGIEHKGSVDLVTNADRAAEDWILEELRREFPGQAVLAEEAGGAVDASATWIVDPLDGTTNFAHGLPIWSVSIAWVVGGAPEVGVVFDPSRGECFSAARGHGATRNGEPIAVSTCRELGNAVLVTGFPYDVQTSDVNNLDHFANFIRRARAVRRLGSAAIDLCWTACGRFDAFWELKLKAWDMAAGALIVREAGGDVTDFGGGDLDLFAGEVTAGPPELLPSLWEVLARGKRTRSAGG
ncbi:MAG: inositol monophosphatase [Gemmatimonadetes bacterium]|nr:inositol monophosphatase [Gemmatimonadota bacterium]